MGNKLREIFSPNPEELKKQKERYYKLHKELSIERECSTCKHLKHVADYPGYVIAEECECAAGLRCDTVLHSVKNCEKWEDSWNEELNENLIE